jgi:hypothetical protein
MQAARGASLLEQHRAADPQAKAGEKERFGSFDRERDMLRGNVDQKRLKVVVQDAGKLDAKFAPAQGGRFL